MGDNNRKEQPSSTGYQMKFLSLNRDGRSAFTPYRPSTILTNLQRGNIKTQSIREIPERTVFELAAQGELYLSHLGAGGVDQVDENGFTPLIWASAYGQLPTVKLLIAEGANPRIKGKNGETALSFAAANGHIHVLRYLLARDVNVDDYDEEGNTALMYAAFNNHTLCVHELLKAKADLTIQNINLETAFSIAATRKSKQVQIILERHILNIFSEELI